MKNLVDRKCHHWNERKYSINFLGSALHEGKNESRERERERYLR
jgi:hypothetical protein